MSVKQARRRSRPRASSARPSRPRRSRARRPRRRPRRGSRRRPGSRRTTRTEPRRSTAARRPTGRSRSRRHSPLPPSPNAMPEADDVVDERRDRERSRTFFAAMWPTFFIRVRPASRNAKPACMNITRIGREDDPDRADVAMASSLGRHATSTSSSFAPGAVVDVTSRPGVVQTIPSPDSWPVRAASTIASTTPSASSSVDDEDQQRLRQEARLEDAAAVLVRDAALRGRGRPPRSR